MAHVVVTLRIMPDSPERDLKALEGQIENSLVHHGKLYQKKMEPVAFGLNALIFSVIIEEKAGGTDPIEEALKKLEGVADVRVTEVTRFVDVKDI